MRSPSALSRERFRFLRTPVSAAVGVAIRAGGRTVGALVLADKEQRRGGRMSFDEDDARSLLATFALALALPGLLYETTFWIQLGFYGFGVMGMWFPALAKAKPISLATSFLVLNSAAWLAFWIWLFGKTPDSWTKILYGRSPAMAGVDHSPATI